MKLELSNLSTELQFFCPRRICLCYQSLDNKITKNFWVADYCVDTVGMDAEMIRKNVKYQDDKETLKYWEQLGIISARPLGFS